MRILGKHYQTSLMIASWIILVQRIDDCFAGKWYLFSLAMVLYTGPMVTCCLSPPMKNKTKKDSSLLAGLASRLQQDIATGNICSSGDRMSEKREESRDAIPSLRGDPMSAFRRDQMPQPMISSFVDVCLSCFLARVWQEAFGRLQR
jgi:hypothetical protein